MNASDVALQDISREYFKHIYEDSPITFYDKKTGNQLGATLKVIPKDPGQGSKEILYFIKTHQYGSTFISSCRETVALEELFVYKFLEKIKIGPETHFFYNYMAKSRGFYIATRDCNYSAKNKNKSFILYDDLIKQKNLLKSTPLQNVEESILTGLTIVDLFCRILRLTDVGNNSTNFGYVKFGGDYRVKIIDFRIREPQSYVTGAKVLFEDFLKGNGTSKYSEFVYCVLTNKDSREKIQDAQKCFNIFQEKNVNFDDSFASALKFIDDYLEKHQIFSDDQRKAKFEKLKDYVTNCSLNLKKFQDRLKIEVKDLKESEEPEMTKKIKQE